MAIGPCCHQFLPPIGNVPVGQHPFIVRLLRAVFNEGPPRKKLVPEWNLLLVLDCLKKYPFEPFKDASLRHLTWKTCFLLAITTFRRCSDLQSLRLGEQLVNVQKKGVTFVRTGLSKQDRPNHTDRIIFIPSLPKTNFCKYGFHVGVRNTVKKCAYIYYTNFV